MKKILFIDRDGTLIFEPSDFQIDSFEKLSFLPGVFSWLGKIARELDYEFVMVTNQDGLGTSSFPEDTLQAPIAFKDNDTIIAGTNLSGGGGKGMSQNSAMMIVAAIERQTAALRAGLFQERGINTPIY